MCKENDIHPLEQFRLCPKCGGKFVVNDEKSKRCESCGFVYYFNPSSATVALILNSRRELLVSVRAKEPAKGTLDLPGGFVDMYETAEEGVAREVKEETSLNVISSRYLFSLPNLYEYSGFTVHTLDMFFVCTVDNEGVIAAHDDVASLKFVPLDKINVDDFGLQSIRRGLKMIMENHLLK